MPAHEPDAFDHSVLAGKLLASMLDAGQALLRHRAAGVAVEHKADRSPVTAADREAEAIVLAGLARAAPDIPVIAEEQVSAGQIPAFQDRAFLVDALDGTKEFIAGGEDFTVNVALVEHGAPVFGLLLAPATGRLFATLGRGRAGEARIPPAAIGSLGGKAASGLAFTAIATSDPDVHGLRVLTSRSHLSPETESYLARFEVAARRGIGSSLKLGLIAAGEADLYVRYGPTSAWDIAAGHAVLVAAGGEVTTPDGAPLRYLQTGATSFLNPPFVAWGRPSLIARKG